MITTVCKISYGSQTVPPIVPAVQGDTGRAISFEIADFTPPAGATATYFILKPSGEAIYNSATITDNSILCELTAQSLAEAGENRMQVRVLQGEDIVTSFEVILMVRTFLGDDAIESGTEMNIFDQAVEQATEQFQENAEQIVEEVIESIPADYTALTEEVDELNERFDDLNDLEINAYDNNDTSNMYIGYYTTVLNGGTPGISDNWGIIVLPVVKGEKIEISGCAETGGANSVWLNSSNPADINKTAWATTANNGVKTCETNWLGLCTYNFSAVYKDIKVLTFTLKNAVEYTQEMQDIILVRENILTSDMIVLDKYWNGTTQGSSNGYRAITPIRVKEGQTISITYAAYAFTGFLPDGGTYAKLTTAGGGGPITYTAPSDGLVYITFTSANDNSEMVVINGGVPAFKVTPNVPISAKLKDNVKIITVATDESGDYTDPYTAYMSVQNDSPDSPVEIHIKAGTYSLNDQFTCPVADTTQYVGIQLIHPYVSFIGEDPATTILEFNGSPESEQISSAQAMTVSIFHMNFGKSYFGTIKNLTLKVKNGRYCIHPETAGKSKGNWTVENCVFNFEGNPNVTGWDGGAVGIGISHGETGHFINCKWVNDTLPGVVGHNNAYGYTDNPIIVPCAKLYFEDCDFNGTNFKIDNLSADTPLHDMLYLINCANINVGEFGSQGGQTAKKWFCVNEGSVITDDRFNV